MVVLKLAAVFSIFCLPFAECLLLEPLKRCVPTDLVRGPCHTCVCTTQGVFSCHPEPCTEHALQMFRVNGKECQPEHMYRADSTICSCTVTGYWTSENCRNFFKTLHTKTSFMAERLKTNIVCSPQELYLIGCNICKCEASGFLDIASCTNRICIIGHIADKCKPGDILRLDNQLCACSDINYYIDRLCLNINNNVIQKIDLYEIAKITDTDISWRKYFGDDSAKCNPSKSYTVDCNSCICTSEGLNCTKDACEEKSVLRQVPDISFRSLPVLESPNDACIPGWKYRYRCNTCVCARDGFPTCTTMVCLEDFTFDWGTFRSVLK